jgi:hypothetical protein
LDSVQGLAHRQRTCFDEVGDRNCAGHNDVFGRNADDLDSPNSSTQSGKP